MCKRRTTADRALIALAEQEGGGRGCNNTRRPTNTTNAQLTVATPMSNVAMTGLWSDVTICRQKAVRHSKMSAAAAGAPPGRSRSMYLNDNACYGLASTVEQSGANAIVIRREFSE
jgi:hypothetical protein